MEAVETDVGVCVPGFRAAGVRKGRYGVALIVAECRCEAAGVFTKNSVKAAPLLLTQKRVGGGLSAVVANSGNALCCIKDGEEAATFLGAKAAQVLDLAEDEVGVASTGIIGVSPNLDELDCLIKQASQQLSGEDSACVDAAKAIMTTDSVPKVFALSKGNVVVGGIAKGSGMIAPNMGTMLSFLTTNASFSKNQLQEMLREAVEESFNMISVDGETSTNDMVLLLASGKENCEKSVFQQLLGEVCQQLAIMIVGDGEGATQLFEVRVEGAKDRFDAKAAVRAIIDSPLVKTMLVGSNPNWGRILQTVGKEIELDFEKVELVFEAGGEKAVVLANGVTQVEDVKNAQKILYEKKVSMILDLHEGGESAIGWGCDLTKEYVDINADYN